MSRVTNNLKKLYEKEELKTVDQIIEIFNDSYEHIEEVFESGNIPDHLSGLTKELALLRISLPHEIFAIMNVGYYLACMENKPEDFLDAFFTYSRLNYARLKLLHHSEIDHCTDFLSVLEHIVVNDIERAKEIFSLELGLSKKGHRFAKSITNLIMAMLHKERSLLDESVATADKFLTTKNPIFDQLAILFLLSVVKKDFDKANSSFMELCKGYKKARWLHDYKSPFLKEIGIFPIGLFKLAGYYLDSEKENLVLPDMDILWKEFILLKTRGKAYIQFEGKLEKLNDFLK